MAKIFISYRRDDSAYASSSIYAQLVARFGRENVFKDVDDPQLLGVDFRQRIRAVLAECAVALVVIGRHWLDVHHADGRRRLDDPTDPVRMEIETAMAQHVPIIPLLVDGAGMPAAQQLPESLRTLVDYGGLFVRPDPDFTADMARVTHAVERFLGQPFAPPPPDPNDLTGQLLAQIRDAFGRQDWPDVVRKADLLIRNAPQAATAEVYRLLGMSALALGENQRARDTLDTALKKEQLHVPTMRALAQAELRLGQADKAAPLLSDALALARDQAERLAILGEYAEALTQLKRWPDLLAVADEALRLGPDKPGWLEVRMRALGELNRRTEALETARRLTERRDASAAQWLARARLEVDLGRYDEAQNSLAAAERLAPGDSAVARTRDELFPPPAPVQPRLTQLGFRGSSAARTLFILPPVVEVPAGEFLMGSDKKADPQAFDNELPQHRVTLPAFQIGTFPVTVAEYACFVRAGQPEPRAASNITWQTQLQRPDHPIVCVTWGDATAFAAWLARLTGQSWRLPTEAEWEKAARWDTRARQARLYPWGDRWDRTRGNSSENGLRTTSPVGTYPNGASPYGALDMAGNVWEWTSSLIQRYPYTQSNGREDAESTDSRVLRGGSWDNGPRGVRTAGRGAYQPDYARDNVGFRIVRSVPGP
jgi:formylglycine-generating enzyme required for sulfatase activity